MSNFDQICCPVINDTIQRGLRAAAVRERSLLKLCVVVGGLIPVAAGLAGIVLGPHFVGATVGTSADSHFRYLSGLLLGIGLGFWSTIPQIETRGDRFRLLSLVVFIGGVGRLISLATVGVPAVGMLLALVMELGVTPLLCIWQWRISRQAISVRKQTPTNAKLAPDFPLRAPRQRDQIDKFNDQNSNRS